jgi:hypothetical protein
MTVRTATWAVLLSLLLSKAAAASAPVVSATAPAISSALPAASSAVPTTAVPTAAVPPKQRKPAKVWTSCVEHVPKGAVRPKLETHMPSQGLSGHAVVVTVVVTHGAGETVLPEGFRLKRDSDAGEAIREAGFRIPEPTGPSVPSIGRPDPEQREAAAAKAGATLTTTVSLPLLLLPKKPGRHRLTLPPLPVSVARASGAVMTLCTSQRIIRIEDPIASEPAPKVRLNPSPRQQREVWHLARQITFAAALVILLALLFAYLLHRNRQRPRVVPAKPKILPWVRAWRVLTEIDTGAMLQDKCFDEHFDAVSECMRRYFGDRYGFDGVESTSGEIQSMMKRVRPQPPALTAILEFLEETDFIKFADVEPKQEDCEEALMRAKGLVQETMPPGLGHADRLLHEKGEAA